MRDYDPTTGRYIQADPLGLVDGASVYGYALQNPERYVDFDGRVIHKSGKTIQCGNDCTIRIDYTIENGVKKRHLHWDCRGNRGSCGEFVDKSHSGSWEDAPKRVQQCALKHGFHGQNSNPFTIPPVIPLLVAPLLGEGGGGIEKILPGFGVVY